jgi:hypothetical protein
MWQKLVDAITSLHQESRIMQHFPYVSVGNFGAVYDNKNNLTQDIMDHRIQQLKEYHIPNILALKGWEGRHGINIKKQKFLFRSTHEWIRYVHDNFPGFVAAATYMEGHLFQRKPVPADWQEPLDARSLPQWWAVKRTSLNDTSVRTGIRLEDLNNSIKYDMEKLQNGARVLICNRVFDFQMYHAYTKLFDDVLVEQAKNNPALAALRGNYEIWPEIELGKRLSSKQKYIAITILGDSYAPRALEEKILHAGYNRFRPGVKVQVFQQQGGGELVAATATVESVSTINGEPTYEVKYEDGKVESSVPLTQISNHEADEDVTRIILDEASRGVRMLKENHVPFVYIKSTDLNLTEAFMQENVNVLTAADPNYSISFNPHHSL